MSKEYGKSLTWDELADIYDKTHGGRRARTQPMDTIFKWAEKQKNRFYVDPKYGTLHLLGVQNG